MSEEKLNIPTTKIFDLIKRSNFTELHVTIDKEADSITSSYSELEKLADYTKVVINNTIFAIEQYTRINENLKRSNESLKESQYDFVVRNL